MNEIFWSLPEFARVTRSCDRFFSGPALKKLLVDGTDTVPIKISAHAFCVARSRSSCENDAKVVGCMLSAAEVILEFISWWLWQELGLLGRQRKGFIESPGVLIGAYY